jgi:hypothetical protein
METNLYPISPEDRKRLGIEQLPETLGEAIEITAESELMLRTFGEHIFNRYGEIKRQESGNSTLSHHAAVEITVITLIPFILICIELVADRLENALLLVNDLNGESRLEQAADQCPGGTPGS